MAFLVRIFLDGKESAYTVTDKTFTIGRSQDAGLTLEDPRVSRSHLTVTLRDGKVWIEDSGSTNGTLVNNRRIQGKNWFQVEFSDRIKLGTSPIEIEIDLVEAKKAADAQFPILPEVPDPVPLKVDRSKDKANPVKPSAAAQATPPAMPTQAPPAPPLASKTKPKEDVKVGPAVAAGSTIPTAPPKSEPQAPPALPATPPPAQHMPPAFDAAAEAQKLLVLKEQILAEAKAKSDELRKSARLESEELERETLARVEAMRKEAHDEYELLLERARREGLMEREALMAELRSNIELERDQSLKKAREQLRVDTEQEFERLDKCKKETVEVEKIVAELTAKKTSLEQESADVQRQINDFYEDMNNIRVKTEQAREQAKEIVADKNKLEAQLKSVQEQLVRMNSELEKQTELKDTQIRAFENELIARKIKLEDEFAALKKSEEAELKEHREEELRQWKTLKEQMLSDLYNTKQAISQDVAMQIEKVLVNDLSSEKLRGHIATFKSLIDASIDEATASMSSKVNADSVAPRLALPRKKSMGMKWAVYASVFGAVALWTSQEAYQYIQSRKSPMTDAIENAAQEKRRDLEARKFNPPQVIDLKDNYVDAVIYTKGYKDRYLSDDFQKKLYLAASAYFLKQWKVPEEKTIQAVSANASLVQTLFNQKDGIHPDFVKDGIQKMRQAETANANSVKQILGSQVKQQALSRFERKFYQDYNERGPAQTKSKH
jgi:hypothetical protein